MFRYGQAAISVAIPSSLYDELAEGDASPIGSRLREVTFRSFNLLLSNSLRHSISIVYLDRVIRIR